MAKTLINEETVHCQYRAFLIENKSIFSGKIYTLEVIEENFFM